MLELSFTCAAASMHPCGTAWSREAWEALSLGDCSALAGLPEVAGVSERAAVRQDPQQVEREADMLFHHPSVLLHGRFLHSSDSRDLPMPWSEHCQSQELF